MSFGFSLGDFFAVGLAGKGAGGAFEEISHEVISLHTAIKELEDEIENADSILNWTGAGKRNELKLLFQNCRGVLQQLNKLLIKYKSLGTGSKRAWDRLRWGTENLAEIREKIMIHTSSLNLFLTTLGTSSPGRIEKKLDQLIDDVRAGKREETILTMADVNEDEADTQWNLWKTELIDDGFTRVELESHKHLIKAKLAELIERGGLHEEPPPDNPTSTRPTSTSNIKPKTIISKDFKQSDYIKSSTKSPAPQATVEDAEEDEELGIATRQKNAREKFEHPEVPESSQEAAILTENLEDYESEESDNTFLPIDSISNVGSNGLKTNNSELLIRKTPEDFQQLNSEGMLRRPKSNGQNSSFVPRTSGINSPPLSLDSDRSHQSARLPQGKKLAKKSNIKFTGNVNRFSDDDEHSSGNNCASSNPTPLRQNKPSQQRSIPKPARYIITNDQTFLPDSDQETDARNSNTDENPRKHDKSPGGVRHSTKSSSLRYDRYDGSQSSGDNPGPSLTRRPTLQVRSSAPPIFLREKPSRSKTEYRPTSSRESAFSDSQSRERGSKLKKEVSSDSESDGHANPIISSSSQYRSDFHDLNNYPRERSELPQTRYPKDQPPVTRNPPSREPAQTSERNQPSFYYPSPDIPEPIILGARPKVNRESRYNVPPSWSPFQKVSNAKNYQAPPFESPFESPLQEFSYAKNYQATDSSFPTSNETQSNGVFSFSNPESIFAEFLRGQSGMDGGDTTEIPISSEVQTQDTEKTKKLGSLVVEKPLPLTLEELFHGTRKKMKVGRRGHEGQTETKYLEMDIKPGWKAGTKIKFEEVGDFVAGSFQDIHFIVEEKKHPLFTREADDFHREITITLLESLYGWKANISTIDGKVIKTEKAGPVQPGSKDIYPGLGMPLSKKPSERGSYILSFKVEYPTNLSQLQKEKFRELLAAPSGE